MKSLQYILYKRFFIILTFVIAVALFFEIIRINSFINEYISETEQTNAILADNLNATLAFESSADFEHTISNLNFVDDYIFLSMIRSDGTKFISKGREIDFDMESLSSNLSWKFFGQYVPINNGDTTVGKLFVLRSTNKLHKKVLNSLFYFLFNIFTIIAFFFFLGRRTTREVSSSISKLSNAFKNILKSEKLEYEIDVDAYSLEIQELSNSFSSLVTKLKLSNESLESLNADLEKRIRVKTQDLSNTLHDMKKYQKRLVAQEKLASLGSLSAGVAHEIKNPLNLISNSSKIIESITKKIPALKNALVTDELTEKEVTEFYDSLDDVLTASQIISKNCDRADGIIKSMLLQTRSEDRILEFINFNELLDRVISLTYHSMRAKDKEFEVNIIKEMSQSIGFKCYPIDLERALVNVLDNSFYAVQKKLHDNKNSNYLPEIKIYSIKDKGMISIVIEDNGIGMSKEVQNNILEPFFTTKPTGEGTGLGMSMVHDICIAHNGDLSVSSREGRGTKIIMNLDMNLGK